MNAKEAEQLFGIIDGLHRNSLKQKAWIVALYGAVIDLERGRTGKTEEQIKGELSRRQKRAFQKLLERAEKIDPGLAAQLDDRDISDLE